MMIDGMGHDLPRDLWPTFAEAIDTNARRARRPAGHAAAGSGERSFAEGAAAASEPT
jgi:hypothetical protein